MIKEKSYLRNVREILMEERRGLKTLLLLNKDKIRDVEKRILEGSKVKKIRKGGEINENNSARKKSN